MDVGVGVSNGAVRAVVIPMVHDFIIIGVSSVFGSPSNILTRVTSYNFLGRGRRYSRGLLPCHEGAD